MVMHQFRLACPACTGISKASNAFLFLGIHADHGQALALHPKHGNKAKLSLRVYYCGTLQYRYVSFLLKNRREEQTTPASTRPAIEHENIRGADYYAQTTPEKP